MSQSWRLVLVHAGAHVAVRVYVLSRELVCEINPTWRSYVMTRVANLGIFFSLLAAMGLLACCARDVSVDFFLSRDRRQVPVGHLPPRCVLLRGVGVCPQAVPYGFAGVLQGRNLLPGENLIQPGPSLYFFVACSVRVFLLILYGVPPCTLTTARKKKVARSCPIGRKKNEPSD